MFVCNEVAERMKNPAADKILNLNIEREITTQNFYDTKNPKAIMSSLRFGQLKQLLKTFFMCLLVLQKLRFLNISEIV